MASQTVLVLGATGATGRLLVAELLARGARVRVVVRSEEGLPPDVRAHPGIDITRAAILRLSEEELVRLVDGCAAIASCLGHTISLRGIYGAPRRLVTDAVRRLVGAAKRTQPTRPVRFVLMNTAGNRHPRERVSRSERGALALLRALLPPHADNEDASAYLRDEVGTKDPALEWAIVRPDTLVDESRVTPYAAHASPTRSALFDAGKTSRSNVAHFMADLMLEDEPWGRWKGRMPVLYNEGAD